MNLFRRFLCASVLALGSSLAGASGHTVSGVNYDGQVQVGGQALELNGAGVRTKAIFKVYTAALYVPTKAQSTEAVLAQPGARRLHLVMLRDIDASELGKLFSRGMEDNSTRAEFSKSVPGVLAMSDVFFRHKRLAKGEWFTADWVPGTGTVITVNGKVATAPIKEPEFYSALLRIWLGQSPADSSLKRALLGQTS